MRARPFRKLGVVWFGGSLLLVGALMPLPLLEDSRWREGLLSVGHFLAFGTWAGLLVWWAQRRMAHRWTAYGMAAGVALGTAALVELVQPLAGRTASAQDLLNGTAGIVVTAGGVYVWRESHRAAARLVHALVAGALIFVVSVPLIAQWRGYRWQVVNFPVLGDFEDAVERAFWKPMGNLDVKQTFLTATREHASRGNRSLRVRASAGTWFGVSYVPGQRNWHGYRTLAFDVFSTQKVFALHVRIDDDGNVTSYSERFNKSLFLSQGWNRLRIPLAEVESGPRERLLNLAAITRLYLFVGARQRSRVFFLDNVRLE